jgi:hypothetical protein
LRRSFVHVASFVLPLGLAACGGGIPASLPAVAAPLGDVRMQSVAVAQAPEANAIVASARHLYVGNAGTNALTIYALDASGDAAPVRTIGGRSTGITCLRQAAVDAQGYVYVANLTASAQPFGTCGPNGGGEILVFAPDANGDAAPVRTIGGPATGIANASAVAVASDGAVYVGSFAVAGGAGNSTLLRFAPGASGDVAPEASIALAAGIVDGLTLDPYLGLVASAQPGSASTVTERIAYYKRDLSSGVTAISYDDPGPLASDPATHTFLGVGTLYGPRIDRFADGTTGSYAPAGSATGPTLNPGLTATLAAGACPAGVAVGPARIVYVASGCTNAIVAFGPNARGHAAPLRTIAGPDTGLAAPKYVFAGP